MKKLTVFLFAIVICLLPILSGCGVTLCQHEYDNGVETTKATCSSDGVLTYTCSKCNGTKTDVLKGGHSYNEGVITKTPTCLQNGEKNYTCTRCNDTKIEEIPALGHTYESGWSYDYTHHWRKAICEHSTEIVNKAEHTFVDKKCSCGFIQKEYVISQENWNNAFVGEQFKNYTLDMSADGSFTSINAQFKVANGVIYSYTSLELLGQEVKSITYYVNKEGAYYEVSKTIYGTNEIPSEPKVVDQATVDENLFNKNEGLAFVDKYSSFTYNDTQKCYTAENFIADSNTTFSSVKIYFEDDYISKLILTDTSSTTTYIFSNYGSTEITDVPSI